MFIKFNENTFINDHKTVNDSAIFNDRSVVKSIKDDSRFKNDYAMHTSKYGILSKTCLS